MGRSSGTTKQMGGKKSTHNTQTKPKKQGNGVIAQLSDGNDKTYLCTHVCLAKEFPKVGMNGYSLKQRACTATIWKDEELHLNLWRYKAEVGYLMNRKPPTPLMSRKPEEWLRPSRFPLGAATQEIEEGVGIKGNLRIPDCIILKISDKQVAELVKKFASGNGKKEDLKHFIPMQDNIDTVVEIKFEGDKLNDDQIRDYAIIAGSNKFRELKERDCHCNVRKKDPRTQPYANYITAIRQQTNFNALFLMPSYVNVQNSYSQNTPLHTFINKPTIAEITFGAVIVTVVIVASISGTPATGFVVAGAALAYAGSH